MEAGDGQGTLACCSPWGHKESDMTEWLNWTEVSNWGAKLYLAKDAFFCLGMKYLPNIGDVNSFVKYVENTLKMLPPKCAGKKKFQKLCNISVSPL